MSESGKAKDTRDILLRDPMAEAGRKLLAAQLDRMLRHEAGSRTGENIESVHQMRVAIRRMRSLFMLIGATYKPKTVNKFSRGLRRIARALGNIRDLDVLIHDLKAFRQSLPEGEQAMLDQVVKRLDSRRSGHREQLNALFDSKYYARFLRQFARLCKKPGRGAAPVPSLEEPHHVRHVLPILLHERLARVRAYDTVLPAAEDTILHALRVEFKQLRYALEFFQPLLGTNTGGFLREVKQMQEVLGRINDIAVFSDYMSGINKLAPEQSEVVQTYLIGRQRELVALRLRFDEQWASFNTRARMRQFSDALLVLR